MRTQITIGQKLTIGVGAIVALMLIMGMVSLNNISRLNAALENATQKTAVRMQLAGTMDTAGSDMFAGTRGTIMFSYAKMPARLEKSKVLFDAAADTWQKSIDQIRPLIDREDSRQVINQLQDELAQWRSVFAEVKELADQGHPDTALNVSLAKALPVYDAANRDTARLRAIQDENLARDRAAGASLNAASRWMTLGFMAISLAVGAAVFVLVRRTSKTLQDTAAELGQSAVQVASAANQICSSSQSLAQGSSEQAASIEETSASSEEITAMTHKNADDSSAAAALMAETSQVVSDANRTLEQMEVSMREINTSSDKIGKIIKVIDEIAFQTNILALNAAVEAARAGEAGLGFAVVADEVRNLAQRSARAAKDTSALIEESIAKSSEGRTKLDQVAAAIYAITERAAKVKALVADVQVGSAEQARGIEQISKAITQMEQVAQSSAAGAEQSAAAGEQLSAQAAALTQVVERLELLVGATRSGR